MSFRVLKIAAIAFLAASVLIAVLLWLNVSRLTRKFAQEQIPGLSLGDVDLAWNSVKLTDFRYASGDSLVANVEAGSVDAHPTFLSFLKDEIEVRQLVIKSPHFRLVKREPDESQTAAGPGKDGPTPAQARADLKEITLISGKGEIEDRTVSGPAAKLTLDEINVTIKNFKYPAFAGSSTVDASCVIKGQPDGNARLTGWLDPVNQSAQLQLDTTSLDLKNLRPYLGDSVQTIENADGTVDLHVEVTMTRGAYTAAGELTITDLRLPRQDQSQLRLPSLLLTQYLKLHGNQVTVPFRLTGDLRKNEHRLDLSALLSGIINQEIGNEALQKKIGLPKNLENLEQDLRDLKERAKKLRKLF